MLESRSPCRCFRGLLVLDHAAYGSDLSDQLVNDGDLGLVLADLLLLGEMAVALLKAPGGGMTVRRNLGRDAASTTCFSIRC